MAAPTPFTIPPAGGELQEGYAYLTDVLTSRRRTEQRVKLRSVPRRALEYGVVLQVPRDVQLAQNLIYGGQATLLGVPLWPYAGRLTGAVSIGASSLPVVTTGCPYVVGEWVIVWRDPHTWEAFEVDSVLAGAVLTVETAAKAWASGSALVIPLQAGRLSASQGLPRDTSARATGTIRLALEDGAAGPGSISLPTYAGFSVLTAVANAREPMEDDADRGVVVLDSGTGSRSVEARDEVPAAVSSFLWTCRTRASVAELRGFLDARVGRLVPFWLHPWTQDFTLAAGALATDVELSVVSSGYAANVFPGGARHHLALRPPGGALQYRKVTAAVDEGDGTETLTLATGLAADLPVGSHCSVLRLCRLEEDEARISWLSGQVAEATLRFRELPAEVPA